MFGYTLIVPRTRDSSLGGSTLLVILVVLYVLYALEVLTELRVLKTVKVPKALKVLKAPKALNNLRKPNSYIKGDSMSLLHYYKYISE